MFTAFWLTDTCFENCPLQWRQPPLFLTSFLMPFQYAPPHWQLWLLKELEFRSRTGGGGERWRGSSEWNAREDVCDLLMHFRTHLKKKKIRKKYISEPLRRQLSSLQRRDFDAIASGFGNSYPQNTHTHRARRAPRRGLAEQAEPLSRRSRSPPTPRCLAVPKARSHAVYRWLQPRREMGNFRTKTKPQK